MLEMKLLLSTVGSIDRGVWWAAIHGRYKESDMT